MISLGVDPLLIEDTSGFYGGMVGYTHDARRFMYMTVTDAVSRHNVCQLHMETGSARLLDSSRVSSEAGNLVGIAMQDMAIGQSGWFLIYGIGFASGYTRGNNP